MGLAGGAALLGIGYLIGSTTWLHVGGWVLFGDSVAAFYCGSALMYAAAFGQVILPLMEPRAGANLPGQIPAQVLEYQRGEPGVRRGQ